MLPRGVNSPEILLESSQEQIFVNRKKLWLSPHYIWGSTSRPSSLKVRRIFPDPRRRKKTDISEIALVCSVDLEPQHEEIVTFDTDLSHYNIKKGVHTNDTENEVYAPVAMWIEALDLILTRMQAKAFDFSRIKGISGAGQQHGSV